jgi:hypothetical protein
MSDSHKEKYKDAIYLDAIWSMLALKRCMYDDHYCNAKAKIYEIPVNKIL